MQTRKAPTAYSAIGAISVASKTISRVLYLTVIYLDVPLPARSSHLPEAVGPTYCFPTVLLRIEFTAMSSFQSSGELLPHLSTLTLGVTSFISFASPQAAKLDHFAAPPLPTETTLLGFGRSPTTRRYISVALFLKSPSAGVTRYPCPVEPGLSS